MRRRMILAGTMVLVGGTLLALLGLYRWAMGPAISQPSSSDASAVMGTSTEKIKEVDFRSAFFTTKISDAYVVRSHQGRTGTGILDRYLLVSPVELGSDQIGITVGSLQTEGLKGVSDIVFRQQNPEIYNPIQIEGAPTGTLVFVSRGAEYQVSMFIPHNSVYAAVVMTSRPDREGAVRQQAERALSYWQWL